MKLNERSLVEFAISNAPTDKEGYLNKKGELNRGYQKRWFVLKGNLLYYFERDCDKEAIGVIIVEHCHIELAESEEQPYVFQISYGGTGVRTYVLGASTSKEMESWMKALTNASYVCLRMMVEDFERRLSEHTVTQNKIVPIEKQLKNLSVDRPMSYNTHASGQISGSTAFPVKNFESPAVDNLISIDTMTNENDLFNDQRCSEDLLPLNFNEFKHMEALHARDLSSYKSKSLVTQDDSSIPTQKYSSGLGKSSRSKSVKRRNNVDRDTDMQPGQFQTFTHSSLMDDAFDAVDQHVSKFKYLHDSYGASIWVKVKEHAKNDLL